MAGDLATRRVWTCLWVVAGLFGPFGAGGLRTGAAATPTRSDGSDVSFPQCGATFPTAPAFGIVGVDGGRADAVNPCLGPSAAFPSHGQSELYWAVASATGVGGQPPASVYVNTADPGNVAGRTLVTDWPTSGSTPYGPCTTTTVTRRGSTSTVGESSPACAWQYGERRAAADLSWVAGAALAIDAQAPPVAVLGTASEFPWWLDVETDNTWQSGRSGIAMNVADLQGMVAAFHRAGATAVGVYSTAAQWSQIAGTTTAASGALFQLPDWVPGATSSSAAAANCALPSFTGGRVALTQWTGNRGEDGDHAC